MGPEEETMAREEVVSLRLGLRHGCREGSWKFCCFERIYQSQAELPGENDA